MESAKDLVLISTVMNVRAPDAPVTSWHVVCMLHATYHMHVAYTCMLEPIHWWWYTCMMAYCDRWLCLRFQAEAYISQRMTVWIQVVMTSYISHQMQKVRHFLHDTNSLPKWVALHSGTRQTLPGGDKIGCQNGVKQHRPASQQYFIYVWLSQSKIGTQVLIQFSFW